jgi:hypothetical protein
MPGAIGDHVRTLYDTILAYVFDDLDNAGIPFKGGRGKSTKKAHSAIVFIRTSHLLMTSGTSRASSLICFSTA